MWAFRGIPSFFVPDNEPIQAVYDHALEGIVDSEYIGYRFSVCSGWDYRALIGLVSVRNVPIRARIMKTKILHKATGAIWSRS